MSKLPPKEKSSAPSHASGEGHENQDGAGNTPLVPDPGLCVKDSPPFVAVSTCAEDSPKPMSREAILAAVQARQKEYSSGDADAAGQVLARPGGFFASLDLEDCRGATYISSQPPPLDWLIEGVLLMGRVAFTCGPPGGSKSTFLIHLAMSVALCIALFGNALRPARQGKVLALFCEEDKRVLWNRVHQIYNALFPSSPDLNRPGAENCTPHFACRAFGDNFFAIPAAGQDVRLVQARGSGDPGPSLAFEELLALAKSIDGLALIILDPLARLYGQNENDNSTATLFCSLIERLGAETGAAVIVNHHVSKGAGSGKDGKFSLAAAMSADAMRGASALTGAARAQINLFPLPKEVARKEVKDKNAKDWQYIAVGVSKNNDGSDRTQFFLKRGEYGVLRVLRPVDVAESPEEKALFEQVKEKVIAVVAAHEREGKPLLTIKGLKDSYHATWKDELPGVTKTVVESAANMAIIEGKLFLVNRKAPGGRTSANYLSTIPETMPDAGQPTPPSTVDAGQNAGRRTPDNAGQQPLSSVKAASLLDSDAGRPDAGQKDLSRLGTRANPNAGRRTDFTPKGDIAGRPASAIVPPLGSDGETQEVQQ